MEGEHELAPRALAQRMRAHERVELGDERGVLAAGEVGLDPRLLRLQAGLAERGRDGGGERLVLEVGERPAAPQAERGAQLRRRALGVAAASSRRPSAASCSNRRRSSWSSPISSA